MAQGEPDPLVFYQRGMRGLLFPRPCGRPPQRLLRYYAEGGAEKINKEVSGRDKKGKDKGQASQERAAENEPGFLSVAV